METQRFQKFILLIDGMHKSLQRIKNNNAPLFGVKGVHALWIYELLSHPDGMTASELAAESMIDRSLISREIEPLRAMGYITADAPGGKRSYNAKLRLTEEGRAAAEGLELIALSCQERAREGIGDEEIGAFYATLEKLYTNLAVMAEDTAIEKNK